VKIPSGASSSLRESSLWTAGGLHHHTTARGPDGTRGFAGAASDAKALVVAWVELTTVRALAPADARARVLLDTTRYSNDSIVYEIAPGPDGALRPREVLTRDRISNLSPPPMCHARGARALGKLRGGGGGGGGGGGKKVWAHWKAMVKAHTIA
jgi:hypothetical protein